MARRMFGSSMVTAMIWTVSALICTGVFANGSCKYECELGYEFCEPKRGSCRNCEDFQDYCFKDFYHISNCTSYCLDHLQQLKSEQEDSVEKRNDTEITVNFILGLVCSALAVGLICAMAYIIYEKFNKKGESDSTDSSPLALSSKDTVTTGTTEEEEPLHAPTPDPEVIVVHLHNLLDVRDRRLDQITTENDEKSAIYVTGKTYEKR